MSSTKVRVNAPCPCGSAKKYKKCCALKKPSCSLLCPLGLKDFDGHFWVEKDGKIIDPYFDSYDAVKRLYKLEGDNIYLPAPQAVQDEWIEALTSFFKTKFGSLEEFVRYTERAGFISEINTCDKTALINFVKNGGKLVFGSLGWKKKGSQKIWWEYGGDSYNTTEAFLKSHVATGEMVSSALDLVRRIEMGETSLEEVFGDIVSIVA